MLLDKTIRKNLDGEYIVIHANQLKEGTEYAKHLKIAQIQIRGFLGHENTESKVDFKEFEKLSDYLKIISLSTIENVANVESIYSLQNLEKIYLEKQKFSINISNFHKIKHLGSEYWKGLVNFNEAYSLQSLVLTKFPDTNLLELSKLQNLKVLHVYNSKIETLDGIENLPLEELALVKNNSLENIHAIKKMEMLKELLIEKCKKIDDYEFIEEMKGRVSVRIIK
ncbi:hypothetical protein HNP24_000710 [Chryseobacterium sediminis]|uniref:Leucine-rich repeat domain-containing protein n=1 Tax=Chryseobacterium sediminis TaxID=1679494 RepID=A0ABR6PVM8_9FLAO|nr:hypothetical protein [Chryseobacterium sediminis]MBB6329760.1 hypothetical protein [Chryseobacterium sediminis]